VTPCCIPAPCGIAPPAPDDETLPSVPGYSTCPETLEVRIGYELDAYTDHPIHATL
jgi:hypothetical protein